MLNPKNSLSIPDATIGETIKSYLVLMGIVGEYIGGFCTPQEEVDCTWNDVQIAICAGSVTATSFIGLSMILQ